ncbi:MAG TPA: class I SAM-dependent methyltransferase [Pyrinomonadaceae bacterium]
MDTVLTPIKRRLRRMQRRRKVGRAYDMALEIAKLIPTNSRVLDVGCGNGFIAHHLTALLQTPVVGLDVGDSVSAQIAYQQFDGRHFPVPDQSFDAVLFCYVLHHAQDAALLINEARRVLRTGGVMIIYEDNPVHWWDKAVCWTHNLQWRGRTGPCTFRLESAWRDLFTGCGFEVFSQRQLSRWRNMAHPVSRNFFVVRTAVTNKAARLNHKDTKTQLRSETVPQFVS